MLDSPEPNFNKNSHLSVFLPEGLGDLSDPQKAIPRLAKDEKLTARSIYIFTGMAS
jgi:hypothetical protein